MSTDQCERCGRYLYSSRERATAEERDRLRAEVEAKDAIFRWLLGEEGEFPERPTPRQFHKLTVHSLFWWRTELRKRIKAASGGGEDA